MPEKDTAAARARPILLRRLAAGAAVGAVMGAATAIPTAAVASESTHLVAACNAVIEGKAYLELIDDAPQAEFDAAVDVVERRRAEVVAHPCTSLADVRAKARVILTEWEDGREDSDFLTAFLRELIAVTG